MNQSKIVETKEFEGICNPLEAISVAKQDLINMFADDFSLDDQKDIFVDGDGRWTDFDQAKKDGKADAENSMVYYLFKVGLTRRAVDMLKMQGLID